MRVRPICLSLGAAFAITVAPFLHVGTADADAHKTESETPTQQKVLVLTPDQVAFQPLNPARGDASPQAGVLWGDIRQDVPSGVLLRFADGFSSPPHIHNITYRAVVISGEVHNDDPTAETMWMGPGSYWTQPAGEIHITSAKPGSTATAFLEILEGPYLVQPGDQAFDNGERPLNMVDTNVVWLSPKDVRWVNEATTDATLGTPKVARLWGHTEPGQLSGSLVKLPSGYTGRLAAESSSFRSVIIKGDVVHHVQGVTETSTLGAGGYFASEQNVTHTLTCQADAECVIYVRVHGPFSIF